MDVRELMIADGSIESVRTSRGDAEVIFVDWQETRWKLLFPAFHAVENFNIEGEDLDRLDVLVNDPYIERVCSLIGEREPNLNLYVFYSAWNDRPWLRIVANECHVKKVNG